MNDDELLNEIAGAAKAERRAQTADPSVELEKLASGGLSEPAIRALEERAKSDPEVAAALALYRPVGATAEERMVAAVLSFPAGASAAAPERARPPRSRSPARILYFVVPTFAAAAAFALFVGRAGRHDEMPELTLSFATTAQTERALPETVARTTTELRPSSLLDIVIRPATAMTGTVGARAALVRDGVARAWSPPIQISPNGAVRISGRAADLLPAGPGRWDVVVAVGRPASLPEPGDLLRRAIADDSGASGYRLVRGRIEMTP